MSLAIQYNEQMLNYYPEVIKAIREFQVLIEAQSFQVVNVHEELIRTLSNAYISDADESRIKQWEQFLGIVPLPQGNDSLETWLQDRRETILARLYISQKMNSKSISDIVSIFTGGTAESYFKDGVVYVLITPPKNNKQFKFTNVEQALRNKLPAHLTFQVDRKYNTWNDVKENNRSWKQVRACHINWESVLLKNTCQPNQLNVTTLENFYLG